MRLGSMWRDALSALVREPATQQYPFERLQAPEHLRSKLHWDLTNCTGCGLCAKDCPSDAIDVIVLDKKARKFVFRYHVDRCTFCSQCVMSCPKKCLEMANDEWELASLTPDDFLVYYGNEEDVETVLAAAASNGADASSTDTE
ncbi:MAG: 4Fe-4S binding protein [Anaerolineae bacterium]|nr:4Fe-4S binding protein [Anaerolineae bacterium]